MDKNYFESLGNALQESNQPVNFSTESSGNAYLTIRTDADCNLYCDGDLLGSIQAFKVKKFSIPTGLHLITISSELIEEIYEDYEINLTSSDENQIIKVCLKQKEDDYRRKQEEMESLKKQEEEKKLQESMRKFYAVISSNGEIITFYYDNLFSNWNHPLDLSQEFTNMNKHGLNNWGLFSFWENNPQCQEFKTAVFDESVSTCHDIISLSYWFADWRKLERIIGLNYLYTKNVVYMSGMFFQCLKLAEVDVSNFDTSQVTDMSSMFRCCKNMEKLDLSNFDTSKVTDMGYMFFGCDNLIKLDLSNFNTSKVTNMSNMFSNLKKLRNIDVKSFDTSKVTDMSGMFAYCENMEKLDLSNFKIENVTNMSRMFDWSFHVPIPTWYHKA